MQQTTKISSYVSPWIIVAVLLCAYGMVILAVSHWDPMRFVNVGSFFDPLRGTARYGYDGQFAYQIARDPLHASQYLDKPAYRYQRILYPTLAYLLSLGGRPNLLPWALILINLLTIVAGTKVTEMMLTEQGESQWYAISYGLFTGLLLSLRLDLNECLAYLFVQLAVFFLIRNQLWQSSAMFILATLSRELSLTFVAAAILYFLGKRENGRAIVWGALTLLPFIVWQVALRLWLGEWAIGSGGMLASNFTIIPFSGLWSIAPYIPLLLFAILSLVVVVPVLLPALMSLVISTRAILRHQNNYGVWSLFVNSLVFPFLPTSNVMSPAGLFRVAIGLMVAILHYGAMNRSKRALNYSFLWLYTLAFLYKDSLIEIS